MPDAATGTSDSGSLCANYPACSNQRDRKHRKLCSSCWNSKRRLSHQEKSAASASAGQPKPPPKEVDRPTQHRSTAYRHRRQYRPLLVEFLRTNGHAFRHLAELRICFHEMSDGTWDYDLVETPDARPEQPLGMVRTDGPEFDMDHHHHVQHGLPHHHSSISRHDYHRDDHSDSATATSSSQTLLYPSSPSLQHNLPPVSHHSQQGSQNSSGGGGSSSWGINMGHGMHQGQGPGPPDGKDKLGKSMDLPPMSTLGYPNHHMPPGIAGPGHQQQYVPHQQPGPMNGPPMMQYRQQPLYDPYPSPHMGGGPSPTNHQPPYHLQPTHQMPTQMQYLPPPQHHPHQHGHQQPQPHHQHPQHMPHHHHAHSPPPQQILITPLSPVQPRQQQGQTCDQQQSHVGLQPHHVNLAPPPMHHLVPQNGGIAIHALHAPLQQPLGPPNGRSLAPPHHALIGNEHGLPDNDQIPKLDVIQHHQVPPTQQLQEIHPHQAL